jgi:hypothetical protein
MVLTVVVILYREQNVRPLNAVLQISGSVARKNHGAHLLKVTQMHTLRVLLTTVDVDLTPSLLAEQVAEGGTMCVVEQRTLLVSKTASIT